MLILSILFATMSLITKVCYRYTIWNKYIKLFLWVELFYDTADEELEITDCEDFSSGGLGIPFNDYAFDVESFVQSL